jgi:hypothetical protein
MTIATFRPLLAAALFAAASLALPAPAQAETLAQAATNICIARGHKQGTPEFEKCYQEVLVDLTVMISDGLGE